MAPTILYGSQKLTAIVSGKFIRVIKAIAFYSISTVFHRSIIMICQTVTLHHRGASWALPCTLNCSQVNLLYMWLWYMICMGPAVLPIIAVVPVPALYR